MNEKREMSAREYLEKKAAMTGADGKGKCTIRCRECPLSNYNNSKGVGCGALETVYPWLAVEAVQEWEDAQKPKTILQDFLEKHPNAKMDRGGYRPAVCAKNLGYVDRCISVCECTMCWNQPLEVKE